MKDTHVIYTKADVALHNGKANNDVWIIIDNFVYDVTQYCHEHPGGVDLILEWAGKDASKEFESIGHSSDASRELKKCRIGVLGQTKSVDEKKSAYIEDQVVNGKAEGKKRKRRPLLLFCA